MDSIQHPDTGSFVRFDYPSGLSPVVQERMAGIAERAIGGLGLDHTFFNIEMIYDAGTDRIGIIEINPRICGQFADLYHKVDGRSSYELALSLAVGDDPEMSRRAGQFAVASSYPLRIFQPMRVARAPDPGTLRDVEAASAGTLVWSECETGQLLQDFESLEDGQSYRYGIVNLGGTSVADLDRRLNEVLTNLGFRFEPLSS